VRWIMLVVLVLSGPGLAGDLKIAARPFAVHRDRLDASPDGFFDISVGTQYIAVLVRNDGPAKTNVTATLSVPEDITLLEPPTKAIGNLPANSYAVLLLYKASFATAAVGKPEFSVSFGYDGGTDGDAWSAFVARGSRMDDGGRLIYALKTPEGTATFEILSYLTSDPSCGFVKEWSYSVRYDTPYTGQHGPLAFNDPWWKVAGLVATCFLSGVACGVGAGKMLQGEPIKGAALAAAGLVGRSVAQSAAMVGRDVIDPIRRGQDLTVPAPGEKTVSETVFFTVEWAGTPQLGAPGTANVTWRYVRVTDGNIYSHQLTEEVTDALHTSQGYTVSVSPGTVTRGQELIVAATLTKSDGTPARGGEVYGSFLLTKDKLDHVAGVLRDDGLAGDVTANDGTYTGCVTVPLTFPTGTGQVFAVFQDVNYVAKGTAPLVAAQTIGGFVITTRAWDTAGQPVPDATVTID